MWDEGLRASRTRAGRLVAVAGVVAACLAIAACGNSSGSGSGGKTTGGGSSSSSSGAKKTVGVLMPESSDNTYSASYAAKLQQLAAEKGVKLSIYNAKFDVGTQASQASALLAQHPDAIIFWPAAPTGARAILLKAQQANIPVDVTNSALSASDVPQSLYRTFTGPSNTKIGATQADVMNKALGGKGQIAIIEGQPANSTNIDRVKGFKAELAKAAPGIKVVCDEPGFWIQPKSQAAASQCLSRFSNKLDGFYASDDITAAGIVQALQAAGLPKGKVKVVSAGGNKLGFPLVKSGWVLATLFQSPVQDATLAMDNILKVLNGQQVPPATYFPTPPVTAQNIDQFTPEW
jgi:ABC-type sugar transport system substrate-binding protein